MLPEQLNRQMELPASLRLELECMRREADARLQRGRTRPALTALADRIAHLLVREARRPTNERGFRMVDLSLFVDGLFPELREVHDKEVSREGHRRQTCANDMGNQVGTMRSQMRSQLRGA